GSGQRVVGACVAGACSLPGGHRRPARGEPPPPHVGPLQDWLQDHLPSAITDAVVPGSIVSLHLRDTDCPPHRFPRESMRRTNESSMLCQSTCGSFDAPLFRPGRGRLRVLSKAREYSSL